MISSRERASNSNTESIRALPVVNEYPIVENKGLYNIRRCLIMKADKERIRRLLNAQGDESDYLGSLQFLSQILYEIYEKKVIISIDEYDVSLENA